MLRRHASSFALSTRLGHRVRSYRSYMGCIQSKFPTLCLAGRSLVSTQNLRWLFYFGVCVPGFDTHQMLCCEVKSTPVPLWENLTWPQRTPNPVGFRWWPFAQKVRSPTTKLWHPASGVTKRGVTDGNVCSSHRSRACDHHFRLATRLGSPKKKFFPATDNLKSIRDDLP